MRTKVLLLFAVLFTMLSGRAQVVSTASTVPVCSGTTTVDIPIKVSAFTAVGSISLKFSYVVSELSSPTVVYKDPGLTAWNTFSSNTSTPGIIIISAFDPNYTPPITGLTLNPNTILFTLRFTIGTISTPAVLSFVENTQGNSCEYGGVGPTFTPFIDTPTSTYYINGSVTIDATPVSPALSSATPVSGTVICPGYNTGSANFTGGSGGGNNEYQYSIDNGGTWLTYTNGASITTTGGTAAVKVRARRSGGACTPSAYNAYTIWTFGTTPVAPALSSASPANATIVCAGYNSGTVAGAAGSGGSTGAADEYRLSINNGSSWVAYTNGAVISTTGATGSVIVQSRRTAGSYGCSNSSWSTICTWAVASAPTAPALGVALPANASAICEGFNTGTVTGAAGSGGSTGAADEYQLSINGGSTWVAYTNGAAINSTGATGSVIVQSRRTAGTYGCSNSNWSTVCTWTVNARKTISGTFYYHNSAGNILMTEQNITVTLYKSSDGSHSNPLATVVTSATGYYEFTSLCPDCDYDIMATCTHSTDQAVNTTDAAQVNFWGPSPYSIEKVKFHAGDVAGPNLFVGATDALLIQDNFISGTPFPTVPWTFWRAGFTILHNPTFPEPEFNEYYPKVTLPVGNNITANMYGLVTGDFNMSFNPSLTKSASSTLSLVSCRNRVIGAGEEFSLPLKMVSSQTIGAVSLVLDFPADLMEVKDVLMDNSGGQLNWSVKGSELRIGWYSPVPISLAEGDDLITLVLKTTAGFTVGNSIAIRLASSPLNELADNMYNVISDAFLGVDVVVASALAVDEQTAPNTLEMSCYPNPFSNFTTISYTLPFEGMVVLEVSNILGNKVAGLLGETQAAGDHKIKFDTGGLPNGVYTATLRILSAHNEMIRTIKLINNK